MLDNVHRNAKQNVQTNAEHGQNFQNSPAPPQQKKERDGRTETGGRALRDGGGQGILKL